MKKIIFNIWGNFWLLEFYLLLKMTWFVLCYCFKLKIRLRSTKQLTTKQKIDKQRVVFHYVFITDVTCGGGVVAKSCPTLATSWTVVHSAPLSMGFPRKEYWSGLQFLSPGDLLDPGIEPMSPALQADSLPLSDQGSPNIICTTQEKHTLHAWFFAL